VDETDDISLAIIYIHSRVSIPCTCGEQSWTRRLIPQSATPCVRRVNFAV